MADQVTIDVDPEGDVILVCGSQEVFVTTPLAS